MISEEEIKTCAFALAIIEAHENQENARSILDAMYKQAKAHVEQHQKEIDLVMTIAEKINKARNAS